MEKSEYQQRDLFIRTPLYMTGNKDKELLTMVYRLESGELQVPPYQRGYIWSRRKLADWIDTVISQQAVGVVVTYQKEPHGGPVWLADGFQRLTSTLRFISNPVEYGFEFGEDQAKEFCKAFEITVQHRHYANHFEAMRAFQNLNKGTPTTPAEYHKGELTLHVLGEVMYNEIPAIVNQIEAPFLSATRQGRTMSSKQLRDSFGLFLQYISGTTNKSFWRVGREQENSARSVEALLMQEISDNKWSEDKLRSKMNSFKSFLASQSAVIKEILDKTNNKGKRFSPTVSRWLFHLSIWRKNVKLPVSIYCNFIRAFFDLYEDHDSIGSRIILFKAKPIEMLTLGLDDLRHLKRLSEYFGISLEQQRNRSKRGAIGYDSSHILPFSEYGEGATIIEPASINRARGAKPISIQDENG